MRYLLNLSAVCGAVLTFFYWNILENEHFPLNLKNGVILRNLNNLDEYVNEMYINIKTVKVEVKS